MVNWVVSFNQFSGTSELELSSDSSTKLRLEDDFTKIIDEVGPEQLISLKSELHYLSVITIEKEQLILYSLKDAIRLLETQYGLPMGGKFIARIGLINRISFH